MKGQQCALFKEGGLGRGGRGRGRTRGALVVAASCVRDAIVKWHVSIYRESQSKSDSQHHTSFEVAESLDPKGRRDVLGRLRATSSCRQRWCPSRPDTSTASRWSSGKCTLSKSSQKPRQHTQPKSRDAVGMRGAEGTNRPTAIFMIPLLSSHSIFCQYTHPVLPKATPQARKPRRSLTSVWVKSCTKPP